MTFGERLIYAREQRGYNQKQFAEALEVTPTRLNYWEKDKREPDVLMLWKIISALQISGNWLIGEEGSMEKEQQKKAPAAERGESDFKKQRLIHNYDQLNELGQDTLVTYSDDIASMPKYTDDSGESRKQA